MPCPFGFTAEDAEEEEEVLSGEDAEGAEASGEEGTNAEKKVKKDKKKDSAKTSGGEEEDQLNNKASPAPGIKEKKSKKGTKTAGKRFDFDADPVSWFYQNQIKSEEEFQAKKEALRAEARKRLDAIMDKKNQRLMWPSDSEFDDLSFSSGELSELDSDVHSLASLRSCAYSWIEDARYSAPAEGTLRWAAYSGLALSAWAMWLGYSAMTSSRKVLGVILQSDWPTYGFLLAIVVGLGSGLALLATQWRAKRLLLTGQVVQLVCYAAAVLLGVLMYLKPTEVDAKLKETACARWGKADTGSRLCQMLPGIQAELAETMVQLLWSVVALGTCSLVQACLGCWYTMELCFIEKKAAKHVRRHKRRKHSIPWEKIKIIGPVTNCGANRPINGGAGPAAKCPVMHTAPKDKNV